MVMGRSGFDIKPTLTATLAGNRTSPARRHVVTETPPVACTLTAAGLAVQGERWQQLMTRALTGRTKTADGLRLSFSPEAEDELRALIAVETECCPWASWLVERTAGALTLRIRSAGQGVTTLHGMFTG
jgi:hypothetical protein